MRVYSTCAIQVGVLETPRVVISSTVMPALHELIHHLGKKFGTFQRRLGDVRAWPNPMQTTSSRNGGQQNLARLPTNRCSAMSPLGTRPGYCSSKAARFPRACL